MPRVSGIYSLPPQYKAVSGQTIRTEQHNPPLEDIAQALTDSLPRDGSAPMNGKISMNGFKITNLSKGTNGSDAARVDQVTKYDAWLNSVAELNMGKDNIPYSTGQGGAALAEFKEDARNLLKEENAKRALTANPVGEVTFIATNTVPDGWLECDGSAVSRSTYDRLFATIGTTFGNGNGSTTFNLPDLRGEFVRGWDNGRGVDNNRNFGSSQSDQIKKHSHSLPSRSNAGGGDGFVEDANGTGTARTAETGETGGKETRPRNIALMPIIRY